MYIKPFRLYIKSEVYKMAKTVFLKRSTVFLQEIMSKFSAEFWTNRAIHAIYSVFL